MKTVNLFFIALIFMSGVMLSQSFIPLTMSYQGFITDTSGMALPDGLYNFIFSIYNVDSGGVALWTENHSAVSVKKGLFNVTLGRGDINVPLNISFDVPYFLGIRVSIDPEMKPRVRMNTVAYSFRSREADGVKAGSISDDDISSSANISATKLQSIVLIESEIVAGNGITITKLGGTLTIAINPSSITLSGDVTGPINSNTIAPNAVTAPKIAPDLISSISGVSNDAGNIDLVAGANITITPNNPAKTITIAATGGITLPYSATTNSASTAFDIENTGTGKSGYFHVTNNNTTSEALKALTTSNNNGGDAIVASAQAGTALDATSTGTEPTIKATNTNASATSPIIEGYGAAKVFSVNRGGDVVASGDVTAKTYTATTTLGSGGVPANGRYYKDNEVYAWAHISMAGNLLSGFGCNSVKIGPGTFQINYMTTFNPNEYAPMAIVQHPVGVCVAVIQASAPNNCIVKIWAWNGATFQEYDAEFFFHLTGRP